MLAIGCQLNCGSWLLLKKKPVNYFGWECLCGNLFKLLAVLEVSASRQKYARGRALLRCLIYRFLSVFSVLTCGTTIDQSHGMSSTTTVPQLSNRALGDALLFSSLGC